MRKKYLVKTLLIKCTVCRGNGRYYPDISPENFNCDCSEPCYRCKGTKFITITRKHPFFKKEYNKFIERKMNQLTTEYRKAKEISGKLREELSKYCKEHDKIING